MNALSNHIEKVYKLFTPVFKEQQTLNYTIILMQKVYMIGAIFSLALSCVGFAFGDFQGTIPAIIAGMIMVFFRVLSSMGFHQLSWILLLIMPTSVLALAPLITPVAPTSIFAFFIFQTFAFILFKRIRILYGFFIFYTLSGALFLYLNFSTYGDKLYDEPSIAYINLVGGLILQFFVLWLMQYIRAKREDTIRFNEAKFQGIFEYNPLGIIVTPQNKSISKMVNERMSDLLGYSKEELSSKGVEVLTHPEDKEAHKQMYQDLLDSRRSFFEIEKRYVHKNGQIIWCKTAVALIRDKAKQPTYVIAMLQDITQRKQQEQKIQQLLEELQTLNAQLEGKVEERTQELSDANKELIRSNQDLEQFAYAASHDLKEPLRMIKSFVQVIDRKYNQHFDETGKTYIGFVTDGVDRMAKLIHCLLQYSKVGQQNFQFQQVNITNIIEHKLLDLQQLVQEKNATIHITNLPKNIVCEKTQLGIVFYNLIANGLKFNNANAAQINITSTDIGEYWRFSVRDNGIGIESAYQDKIFKLFTRLNTREEFEGTGIGLSLCQKIIYRHGGEIWLDSTFGEGTTFYFTISKNVGQASKNILNQLPNKNKRKELKKAKRFE